MILGLEAATPHPGCPHLIPCTRPCATTGDMVLALPGGPGRPGQVEAPFLQVVFEDDDQGEVAGSQRAQDAARTWGGGCEWADVGVP